MMKRPNTPKWVFSHRKKPEAKLRLFCFPYGGAGASIYKIWERLVPDSVELCLVQLPGRENRRKETLVDIAEDITVPLIQSLPPVLLDKPAMVFGHSMGALLAYDFVKKSMDNFHVDKLIVSASKPPPDVLRKDPLLDLPDDQFLSKVAQASGYEINDRNIEVLSQSLEILRNDFKLCENYVEPAVNTISCPILEVLSPDDELVQFDALETRWGKLTTNSYSRLNVTGGHLFLANQSIAKAILSSISNS